MWFNNNLPTKRELERRYGITFYDGKFPWDAEDDCCTKDPYVADFVSHRMRYHKMSRKQTLQELDEFMERFKKNEITRININR